MGPSMFSVYLLHEAVSPIVSRMLYNKFLAIRCGNEYAQICLTTMVVFSVCVVIDLLRRRMIMGRR